MNIDIKKKGGNVNSQIYTWCINKTRTQAIFRCSEVFRSLSTEEEQTAFIMVNKNGDNDLAFVENKSGTFQNSLAADALL